MAKDKEYPLVVDAYGSSAPGSGKLNQAIGIAWRQMLADPVASAAAAKILGIAADKLATDFPQSPYVAKPNTSGFGPVEIAILIFAGNVAYDVAKGVAKTAAEAALRKLWKDVIQPKVVPLLPWAALDDRKKVDGITGRDDT